MLLIYRNLAAAPLSWGGDFLFLTDRNIKRTTRIENSDNSSFQCKKSVTFASKYLLTLHEQEIISHYAGLQRGRPYSRHLE